MLSRQKKASQHVGSRVRQNLIKVVGHAPFLGHGNSVVGRSVVYY